MNEQQSENLSNRFIDGKRTKKELEQKGLVRNIERRMLKIDSKTYIEAPKDLKPEEEAEYIKKKIQEIRIDPILQIRNSNFRNDKFKTENNVEL